MRPLVRCVTSSAHWNAPSESGIGRLPTTESLYSDLSCCARETHGIATVAPAAAPASSTERRVVLSVIAFLQIDLASRDDSSWQAARPRQVCCDIKSREDGPWRSGARNEMRSARGFARLLFADTAKGSSRFANGSIPAACRQRRGGEPAQRKHPCGAPNQI